MPPSPQPVALSIYPFSSLQGCCQHGGLFCLSICYVLGILVHPHRPMKWSCSTADLYVTAEFDDHLKLPGQYMSEPRLEPTSDRLHVAVMPLASSPLVLPLSALGMVMVGAYGHLTSGLLQLRKRSWSPLRGLKLGT